MQMCSGGGGSVREQSLKSTTNPAEKKKSPETATAKGPSSRKCQEAVDVFVFDINLFALVCCFKLTSIHNPQTAGCLL